MQLIGMMLIGQKKKVFFFELYDNAKEMDIAILNLAKKLSLSNPKSMKELKEIMWAGTNHWDELLIERAAISGERVLSDFTKKTLEKLKKK